MACDCKRFEPTLNITGQGQTRIVRELTLRCLDCGQVFYVHAIGTKRTLVMKPTPPAPPRAERKAAPTKKQRRQATFERLAQQWTAAGGEVPASWGPSSLPPLADLKDGVQLLAIGDAIGLAGLALDQTPAAGPHAVVADAETRERLAPLVTRCKLHADTWRPAYGTLYNGIVVAGLLSPEWFDRVPQLLKPGGDCWLIGEAQQYEAALSAKWGYKATTAGRGQPDEHLFFLGTNAPLGDGPGTELHDDLKNRGMPSCQTCRRLAHQMNAWGVAGCRELFAEIVEDIMPRARDWWANADHRQKLAAWWKGDKRLWSAFTTGAALATADVDAALLAIVRQRVTAAIDAAERKIHATPAAT